MSTVTQVDLSAEFSVCLTLYSESKFQESLARLLDIQKLVPENVDVKYVVASCQLELGQYQEAECLFLECLQTAGASDKLSFSFGRLYEKAGHIDKAIAEYNNVLAMNQSHEGALNNLGNIYNSLGQSDLALQCFNALLNLGLGKAYIYNNIASVYRRIGLLTEARDALDKCLALNPQMFESYVNAAQVHTGLGHKQNAYKCYEMAHKLVPDNTQVICEFRDVCITVCDWKKYEELDEKLRKLVADGGEPEIANAQSNIQRTMDLKENLECAMKFIDLATKDVLKNNPKFSHDKHQKRSSGKIRIGYMSSDIGNHPVSYLMRGVFRNHNKEEFEVFIYSSSSGHDNSGYKGAIKSYCDQFVDIAGQSNLAVAHKIYNDNIDVLIDLNGHTGRARLEVLALKPAPIQIQYIGFVGSMGADFIDYVIADKIVTPPEHQKYYLEKFLYMPNCYQANDNELAISKEIVTRKEFGLPSEGFVFCSFNQAYKIEPVMFKVWMSILKRVEGSVLWLFKGTHYVDDTMAVDNILKNAAEYGIDKTRIIFADAMPLERHLRRMSLADLALDTRIYNGGTITTHSLWAGIPVLTLLGEHFASRMAASIVSAVGMPELITNTLEEYEELAVKIATKKGAALKLKNKLAINKKTQPLFDTKQFTKDMEQLYKNVWNEYLTKDN